MKFTVVPNVYGWRSTGIFTNRETQYKALNETVSKANLDADLQGNLYYVADDKALYTYRFETTGVSRWINEKISSSNASGPFAIKEPQYGQRTLYYATTSNEVQVLTTTGYGTPWVLDAGKTLTGFIPSGTDIVAVVFPKQTTSNTIPVVFKAPYLYLGSTVLVNQNAEKVKASGESITWSGDYLYYRDENGKFSKYNIATGIETNYSNYSVNLNSDIVSASNGRIWFTQWGTMVHYRSTDDSFVTVWSTYNPSGKMSINQNSGTVYYTNSSREMMQLYPQSANVWGTNKIGRVAIGGDILFSNPNVFFVSETGYIMDLFYFLSGCQPSVFRTALSTQADDPESMLDVWDETEDVITPNQVEMELYPNPTTSDFNIKYFLEEEGKVTISIINMLGVSQGVYYNEFQCKGAHEIGKIGDLSNGVYLVRLEQNDKLLFIKKLIISSK